MKETFTWITSTPAGVATAIGVLSVIFLLAAFIVERRTRKLFPDKSKKKRKRPTKKR